MGAADGLLLERDRELERIRRCLQRAQKGQGSALVVEGPAGIGKTVLLAAARDAAESEGFRWLRARGAELERELEGDGVQDAGSAGGNSAPLYSHAAT